MAPGTTPPRLHVAVKQGDVSRFKQYITAGDDINAVDELGSTPLIVAVRFERLEIVQILLDAGADTSVQKSTLLNALSWAVIDGSIPIIKVLNQAGTDLNAGVGKDQTTPLMLAACAGDVDVVRLLIQEGCDVRKRAADDSTALYAAVRAEHINVVEILLDAGVDVNETTHRGNSVLACAVQAKNLTMIAKLLERGADVGFLNANGSSALHFSSYGGSADVTDVLLRAGADPNKQCYDDRRSPLHIACMEGHVECARLLLFAGANVSATDNDGCTPLHCVQRGDHSDLIELLLSAGSDVNTVDNTGNLPLSLAVARGDPKAVRLLLEAGSDVNSINKLGKNVLFGLVDLDIVKVLLARGADATVVDIFSLTVLHSAVINNASGGVICALFRAGADPTAKDVLGDSAADHARSRGYTETAKLLDLLEVKHRETRGDIIENIDSNNEKAAKMSVAAALMDEVRKIAEDRIAEKGVHSDELFTKDDMTNILNSLKSGDSACEEAKESVEECKDGQQSSSALPCLNCEAMTSRRCSGCGISYFCSKKCEVTARHVCCG